MPRLSSARTWRQISVAARALHELPAEKSKALIKDCSSDPGKRDLQLEAVAHIAVQERIDGGGLPDHPLDPAVLQEMHKRFCKNLPESLLTVRNPDGTDAPLLPGAFRTGRVQVGKHVVPNPGAVPRLLAHMRRMYAAQGRTGSIIATACAHHRLVRVHPCPDLNGRVPRMVAHAMLRQSVTSEDLWSASRGLARQEAEYKQRLMAADQPSHGGADGRGSLSEQRLAEFSSFFLKASIDQIRFMETLMQPQALRGRIDGWCKSEIKAGRLLTGADTVMREALALGALERGMAHGLFGVSNRQARKVTAGLLKAGAPKPATQRVPLRLNFTAALDCRGPPIAVGRALCPDQIAISNCGGTDLTRQRQNIA